MKFQLSTLVAMLPLVLTSASFATARLAWGITIPGFDEAMKQPAIQAAVMSGGFGLGVFALTQWVLNIREKSSLLLEKLELLYIALNRLSQLGPKRSDFFSEETTKEGLIKVRGSRLINEITMLQAFYFPAFRQPIDLIVAQNGVVLSLLAPPGKTTKEELIKAIRKLNRLIALASSKMRKKQRALTRARWYRYIPFLPTLSIRIKTE